LQWRKEWTVPVTIVVSASVGYALSIFLHKRTEKLVEEIRKNTEGFESEVTQLQFKLSEDREKMDSLVGSIGHTIRKFKDEGREFLDQIANDVARASMAPRTEQSVDASVFSGEEDDWDYEEELKDRGQGHPYIIHRDEFFSQEEVNNSQSTLTYYRGDNVLCDELDTPIYNMEKVVGTLIFGKGSQDPNVVYVRNEELEAEYEVLLDHGYYQTEVLGQAVEDDLSANDVKHSKHSVRKFRAE
jgi:hypothetical protein